ncbi:catalase [Robiginitomaculum antarcticum]|uniref:catalase n=1 Tax=Robiginitomaculum antarcticum TaxID=437507 RepID=UPI0012EAFB46|nr:catalase [Robiginitomaculum antarcticum]
MTDSTKLPKLSKGGAPHQTTEDGYKTLTTKNGTPVSDNQNHLKAGSRGPMLTEDFAFREKMFHFDHERIPERVVHARGYGMKGYFELTDDLSDVTDAKILTETGKKTEAFMRISTVAGNKGSPDLARDVRGFAVKIYTDEGNWDIVGNNIPVFFIQDAIKFPDLIHAAKPEPDRGFPQAQTAHDNFWDFISLSPETMHMVMWIMSDRTIPRSLRFMEGFGVHTFRLLKGGKSKFVKFHWKPKYGMQSVAWNEAVKINGADPDYHRRDIFNSINDGAYPEWELGVQIFDQDFADNFEFDVLDPTKLIPEEDIPVRIIGRLVMNKNVDNFFAETEQVAFCTANVPPGIGFSNDPLLQGRNFSYLDTQLKRLGGPNFQHIPVNRPRCPMHNFQQDGHMAMENPKGRANYEPNSWGTEDGGPRENPKSGYKFFEQSTDGTAQKIRPESFADHYSQARQFYISQTKVEQTHIQDALCFELSKVKKAAIRELMVSHLRNIEDSLAKAVAKGLGMSLPKAAKAAVKTNMDIKKSDALSMHKNPPESFASRTLGIMVAEGSDAKRINALKSQMKKMKANVAIIAPTVGGVELSDGTHLDADEQVGGGPSVLYDAIAVIASDKGGNTLADMPPAKDFVSDAHAHKKFIAYDAGAKALFKAAGLSGMMDAGYTEVDTKASVNDFSDNLSALRFWARAK